jgi:anti-sigma-K factor RskA
MSGSSEDQTLIAGEYVLGLMDAVQMRVVEAQATEDPVLAGEIAFWEDRLAPLTTLVTPVEPPAVLWSRLALATGIGGAMGAQAPRRRSGSYRAWQASTAAALAIAASFAYFAFLPRPASPDLNGEQFIAALGPTGGAVPYIAQARADGSIAITHLAGAPGPGAGRDFQLWALPRGATRPISLGVLPAGSAVVRPPERPLADEQLLVSDEPAGGSPTGLPTGAVVFGGTLSPVSPAATPGR